MYKKKKELAYKLKDTISHYWSVWRVLRDKEGRKSRIQNSYQTARLYALEGHVPRLSLGSGNEEISISLFPFFCILMAVCTFHN